MYGSIVAMLNIGKTLIPGAWVLGILHVKDVHNHLIDDLSLAIHIEVEGSGLGDLGV
jgi:hypothetical protein